MRNPPVTDATGREIRPPAKVERVYAAGPPASLLVFAIAPDKLIGWTRAMRPNEAQFFRRALRAAARARPAHRARQHRERRGRAEGEDRPHRRRRLDRRDARLARRRRCRSRPAFPTRCSMAASRPRRRPCARSARLMGNEARGGAARRLVRKRAAGSQAARRRGLGASARLLRARRVRPADRRQGLDQRRGARVPRRAQRRRRGARRACHRVARAGDPVGPRSDPDHRPELLADRSGPTRAGARCKAVAAKRVYLSPHLPVRLVRLPAGREPPARHLVGRQAALSAGLRTSTCAPRSPSSTACSITASRRAAQLDALLGEPGVLPKMKSTRLPALTYVLAAGALLGLDRARFRGRPLPGLARRDLDLAALQSSRAAPTRARERRDRGPAGARAARAGGAGRRRGARRRRHRLPGHVPQPAGVARHPRRVGRRGARRGARRSSCR